MSQNNPRQQQRHHPRQQQRDRNARPPQPSRHKIDGAEDDVEPEVEDTEKPQPHEDENDDDSAFIAVLVGCHGVEDGRGRARALNVPLRLGDSLHLQW